MKREFLEGLNLEAEVIEKIMAEHGKSINTEKSKVEEKDKEIEILNTQLKDVNKTIKSYKDMNIEDIKKSAEDLETKYNEAVKDLENHKRLSAVEKQLLKTKTVDVDILKKLINMEDLKFKDDEIIGLDVQIENIKTNKPYLFETDQEPESFLIKNSESTPTTQTKTNFSDYAEETRLIKN